MIDQLSAAGYKVTGPRRRVLAALRSASNPQTALELAERSGTSVASTYRALALLVELGLVSEVEGCAGDSDNCHRYALCSATGHHHHFVCRTCHSTIEIASPVLEAALQDIARTTGLRIEQHELTLRGQCVTCQGETQI